MFACFFVAGKTSLEHLLLAATIQDWMVTSAITWIAGVQGCSPSEVSSWDVTCMDYRLQIAVALVASGRACGEGFFGGCTGHIGILASLEPFISKLLSLI